MDFDVLFPGRFLKAGQFKGKDVTLTVKSVKVEKMPKDGGGEETKGIVSFNETPLELVLNKTNGLCVRAMFGRETNDWLGKRVTLYPADFEGDLCIRVRGSPDLTEDVTFELKLARKKGKRTVMKKTASSRPAGGNAAHAPAAPAPVREPSAPPTPPSAPRPVEPAEPTRAEPPAAPTEDALAALPF